MKKFYSDENSNNIESNEFPQWIKNISKDIEELNKINAEYQSMLKSLSTITHNLRALYNSLNLSSTSENLSYIRDTINNVSDDKGYVYCVVPAIKIDCKRGYTRNVVTFQIHHLNTDILCFKKGEDGTECIYLVGYFDETMRLVPLEMTFPTLEEAKKHKLKLERECYLND